MRAAMHVTCAVELRAHPAAPYGLSSNHIVNDIGRFRKDDCEELNSSELRYAQLGSCRLSSLLLRR